jgi:hypothetical protein
MIDLFVVFMRNVGLLAAICGLFCFGCGRSEAPARPSTGGPTITPVSLQIKAGVTVPEDCQQWLGNFLEALFKTRDTARIQELTIPRAQREELARAPETARQAMAEATAKNVQQICQQLGALKSCSVEYCQERIATKDVTPGGAFGAGRHIEIHCAVKGAKRTAKATFTLYKRPESPDPMIGVWNFTWSPL